MAKNKSSEKTLYELLYLVSNKFSEDELPAITGKVEGAIAKEGGIIKYRETWGKKKLAYRIKLFTHGYYFLVVFELDGERLAILDRSIRMMSEILRHQALRTTEEALKRWIENKDKNLEEETGRQEKTEKTKELKEEKKTLDKKAKESATKEEKADTNEKAAKIEEKDEKSGDLDERLNKILEGTDLLK